MIMLVYACYITVTEAKNKNRAIFDNEIDKNDAKKTNLDGKMGKTNDKDVDYVGERKNNRQINFSVIGNNAVDNAKNDYGKSDDTMKDIGKSEHNISENAKKDEGKADKDKIYDNNNNEYDNQKRKYRSVYDNLKYKKDIAKYKTDKKYKEKNGKERLQPYNVTAVSKCKLTIKNRNENRKKSNKKTRSVINKTTKINKNMQKIKGKCDKNDYEKDSDTITNKTKPTINNYKEIDAKELDKMKDIDDESEKIETARLTKIDDDNTAEIDEGNKITKEQYNTKTNEDNTLEIDEDNTAEKIENNIDSQHEHKTINIDANMEDINNFDIFLQIFKTVTKLVINKIDKYLIFKYHVPYEIDDQTTLRIAYQVTKEFTTKYSHINYSVYEKKHEDDIFRFYAYYQILVDFTKLKNIRQVDLHIQNYRIQCINENKIYQQNIKLAMQKEQMKNKSKKKKKIANEARALLQIENEPTKENKAIQIELSKENKIIQNEASVAQDKQIENEALEQEKIYQNEASALHQLENVPSEENKAIENEASAIHQIENEIANTQICNKDKLDDDADLKEYTKTFDHEKVLNHKEIVAINNLIQQYYKSNQIHRFAYQINTEHYRQHEYIEITLTNNIADYFPTYLIDQEMEEYKVKVEEFINKKQNGIFEETIKTLYIDFLTINNITVPLKYKTLLLVMFHNEIDKLRKIKQEQDYYAAIMTN
ncbi:hypothetical protein BDAP_000431 [Binucleata daphniae]